MHSAKHPDACAPKLLWKAALTVFLLGAFGAAFAGPTTTQLTTSAASATIGNDTTFTARVTPPSATGTVLFRDGATTIGTASLSGGTVSIVARLPYTGNHNLTAVYSGDSGNTTSTSPVVVQTIVDLVADSWRTVAAEHDPLNLGMERVVRYGMGTVWVQRLLSVSSCSNEVFGDPLVGTFKRCDVPSTVPSDFTLTAPATPPVYGVSAVFTARVGDAGATGSVSLYDGPTVVATASLAAGVISFPVTFTSAGPHTLHAVYAGNSIYAPATSANLDVTVGRATVGAIVLASNANPVLAGQTSLLSATVVPAIATGTVTFYDGSTSLGVAPVNYGIAALLATFNASGARSVTAVYSGDPSFLQATSSPLVENVTSNTPDPVALLAASQGTVVGAVNLSWNPAAGATTYGVYRDVVPVSSTPTLLSTISGTSYTDSTASAGQQYFYFVRGFSGAVQGPITSGVLGYSDTPPTGPAADFSTLQDQPVTFTPTWLDSDPGDTFVVRVVTPAQHGNVALVAGQFVYTPVAGYLGLDSFQFSVTDRAGATVIGVSNGSVAPAVPDAPRDFVASQGTNFGFVRLLWSNTLGSRQYLVLRSLSSADPNPATIATVASNTFDDRDTTPGAVYFYRIKAVGANGTSPFSKEVSGYADTAPTQATAAATTLFNTPVTFTATVVDADQAQTYTLAIVNQPANGTVALTPDLLSFIYTPRTDFAGVDRFDFTATDIAGAAVAGSGSIGVGCPAPTLSALTVAEARVFAGAPVTVSGSYGNTGCPGDLTASLVVKSGTTVVYTAPGTIIRGAVSAPVSFSLNTLQAGSYDLELTVADAITGAAATSSIPVSVVNFRMPTFTVTATALANLDIATIAVGSSQDCTLTESRAAAIGDHSLCYFEVLLQPSGLARDLTAPLPTWSGKVPVAGAYRPIFTVYRYDDRGVASVLGSIEKPMDVQPLDSMQFTSPASLTVAQFLGTAAINVSQTAGTPCQVTTDRAKALAGTARGTRMCLIEFNPVPAYATVGPTGVSGPFLESGTNTVRWDASTFDLASNQLRLGSGSTTVNVVPPDVSYEVTSGTATPIATVTRASIGLNQTGSDRCAVTVDLSKANTSAADRPCFVQWTTIPTGLAQDPTTSAPSLVGLFLQPGNQAVGFDVVYFDAAGTRQVLLSATKPFSVDAPPLPTVRLINSHEIQPGMLTAPVAGGSIGTVVLDVAKWPMDAAVKWSDDGFWQTYRISPTRGTQIIPVTAAPLWTKRQVTIKLFLRAAPDLYVEKTYDVLSVPIDGITFTLNNIPETAADSQPMPVSSHLDIRTKTGNVYDAATMGQWSVQYGLRDATGKFVPQGDPSLTDASGVATGAINVFGQTVARVVAKATSVSPEPAYVRSMESAPKVSTVVKGTPIDGSVVVKGLSEGPTPFIAILRIAFNTRSDQLANESVNWKMSKDGGSTWGPMDNTGLQIVTRLGEGNYLVKAELTNRNTRLVSETAAVPLTVWSIPKIHVTGNTFAFPGAPSALSVSVLTPAGQPANGAALEWTVKSRAPDAPGAPPTPPLASGTTSTVQFTAQKSGVYLLTVRARMPLSNPDDPRAWGTSLTQITYGAPERPSLRITGPVRAEVGKPYSFDLSLRTRYSLDNTSLTLAGEWTLPDGTSVPSLTSLTYSPTDADLAAGKVITLKYRAWVVGYEESTASSALLTLPIWRYVWPDWRVVSSVTSPYAPTSARLTVMASDLSLVPTLEGLSYTWTIPATARVLAAPSFKLDAVVDYGGVHPFSVVITDARGHSTTVDTDITVQDAKPYVLDLSVSNMSKWTHSPLTLGLSTRASGGHPLDGITTWKYYLDDELLATPNKNTAIVPIDSAGTHKLEVRITSKMGSTASKVTVVTIPSNQPPTCGVTAVPTPDRRFIAIQARCADPDGAITRYSWSINGVPQQFSNGVKWTYIVQPGITYPITVDLAVVDDGGLASSGSVTVP